MRFDLVVPDLECNLGAENCHPGDVVTESEDSDEVERRLTFATTRLHKEGVPKSPVYRPSCCSERCSRLVREWFRSRLIPHLGGVLVVVHDSVEVLFVPVVVGEDFARCDAGGD